MKIDLHITDATPEEVLRFLGRYQDYSTGGIAANQVTTVKSRSVFAVPFKCGTPEYQRAMRLCKKFDLPYDLTLKKANGELDLKQSADIKPGGIHWKNIIRNSVNPPHEPIIQDVGEP